MTPTMISTCEREIGATFNGVPVIFEGGAIPADASIYIRFYVVASDETVPVGMGRTAKKRNVGLIQASVHGPRGDGAGVLSTHAMAIWKLFSRRDLAADVEGLITFKEGSIIASKGTKDEEMAQIVRVPYRYDFAA